VSHRLAFGTLYEYATLESGITIPVALSVGAKVVDLFAKVDTGAAYCVFQREFGEDLGLDIERGDFQRLETLTGAFPVFGHEVTLHTLGLSFEAQVYFASITGFPRNVLGRHGWLQQVRLGLIDHDGKLFVSHYNEPA
jgi:hypothetical protein